MAERVPDQEGVFRLRPDIQSLGQAGAPGTGVTGVAYFTRADGTLEPNIAVGMAQGGPSAVAPTQAAGTPSVSESASQGPASRAPEPATEASPAGKAEASASDTAPPQKTEGVAAHASVQASGTSGAEAVTQGAEVVGPELVEEKIRHAVLELFSPGKLVGGRFHDIEHFREKYQEAKAIENPWEAQQSQDYVVYLFVKEIGVSEPAARTLLELPKAKWEPLATLIASVAH